MGPGDKPRDDIFGFGGCGNDVNGVGGCGHEKTRI